MTTATPCRACSGWWIVLACGLAVLALGLLTTGRWARRTADRTAAALPAPVPDTPAVVASVAS